MTGIVLASVPYKPPPIPLDQGWFRTTHTLRGWDGSEFNLSDPDSGVFLTHGVRGMKNPTYRHHRDERATIRGTHWRGYIEESRECFWPIYLYSDVDSAEWLSRYRAFWRALSPEHESIWEVRAATFGTRRLRVRLEGDSTGEYEIDPMYLGWSVYGINLVADQPMWEGEDMVRTFAAPSSFNFTGPDGGPPFYLAPVLDTSTAVLTNEGDVDSYIVWTVEGPQPTGVTLGFDSEMITVPFEIPSGQTLTVDTRPEYRTATMQDGTRRTSELTNPSWKALPPGAEIPLSLAVSGTGTVTASLTPLYRMAL